MKFDIELSAVTFAPFGSDRPPPRTWRIYFHFICSKRNDKISSFFRQKRRFFPFFAKNFNDASLHNNTKEVKRGVPLRNTCLVKTWVFGLSYSVDYYITATINITHKLLDISIADKKSKNFVLFCNLLYSSTHNMRMYVKRSREYRDRMMYCRHTRHTHIICTLLNILKPNNVLVKITIPVRRQKAQ